MLGPSDAAHQSPPAQAPVAAAALEPQPARSPPPPRGPAGQCRAVPAGGGGATARLPPPSRPLGSPARGLWPAQVACPLPDPDDPQVRIRSLEERLHEMEVRASQAGGELEHHLHLQIEQEQHVDRTMEDEWDLQELLAEEGLVAAHRYAPLNFDIQLQQAQDQGQRKFRETQGAALE
uniref:Uncharacterized protein n=1 Tax=Sphaerodactylus townsendi TaxID=933632 RepID=A0ACB8F7G5_9SAUR